MIKYTKLKSNLKLIDMKNKVIQVIFACVFGAIIGGCIAQRISNTGLALFIGALSGGITAYLVYDLQAVTTALKNAVKMKLPKRQSKEVRRLKRKIFAYIFFDFLSTASIIGFFTVVALVVVTAMDSDKKYSFQQYMLEGLIGYGGLIIIMAISGLILSRAITKRKTQGESAEWIERNMSRIVTNKKEKIFMYTVSERKIAFLFNPLLAPFSIIGLILSAIVWLFLPKQLKAFFKFTYGVGRQVFITIHSSARVICFISAAVGTVIGFIYFSGLAAVVIGAVAGGVLGYIHYKIVAVKWLKLEPR